MTDVLGENQTTTGWTVDDSTFGARLALVRHRMGWNVKEAARECTVPAASWRSWEEGAQPHRIVEIAERIAARTGCDYGWLLAGNRLVAYAAREGHTVVVSGSSPRQTTVSYPPLTVQPGPTGQPKRTSHPLSSRRPARVLHA